MMMHDIERASAFNKLWMNFRTISLDPLPIVHVALISWSDAIMGEKKKKTKMIVQRLRIKIKDRKG